MEQPVNPDETDDFYNWPWLNAGEMGDWKLTPAQVVVLRAMAVGARVVVETARGEEWDPLVLGAGVGAGRFLVQGVGQALI